MLSGIAMGSIFPFFTLLFVQFKSMSVFIMFFMSCVGAGVCVGLISFTIGKTTVINAIKKLQVSFEEVRMGDLSARCDLKSNDEIGQATEGFNQLVKSLSETVDGINESAENIDNSTNKVNHELDRIMGNCEGQFLKNSSDSNLTMSSMQKSIEEISDMVMEQQGSLQECSRHLDTLQNESNNIKARADRSVDETDSLRINIENEKASIKLSGEIFQEIRINSDEVIQISKIMENSSRNMVEILNTTTGLLKQTNTLALNAKIESSRENTDGRGFAVVAEEMIKLAGATNELVERMQSITDRIIEDIKKLNNVSNVSSNSIDRFENINEASNRNMNDILEGLISAADQIKDMDESICNQVKCVEDMKENWDIVKNNSSEILEKSQSNRKTIHVMRGKFEDIHKMSDNFKHITMNLKRKVEFFRSGD